MRSPRIPVRFSATQRPGPQPQHVFDWEDGLRLIVSRDRFPDGRLGIAVSGSLVPAGALHRQLQRESELEDGFCAAVSERWRVLANSSRIPEFLGWSREKGVPHFVVWDEM